MILKSITIERIIETLYIKNRHFYIVYTTELDPQIILRIYINKFNNNLLSLLKIAEAKRQNSYLLQ